MKTLNYDKLASLIGGIDGADCFTAPAEALIHALSPHSASFMVEIATIKYCWDN
jgi:hypothetical protein